MRSVEFVIAYSMYRAYEVRVRARRKETEIVLKVQATRRYGLAG